MDREVDTIVTLPSSSARQSAFNAVKLSAQDVASSFIDPPVFHTFARADNVILVGPRGSGKTTFLKMLQSEALEHWDSEEAASVADEVTSIGVFVGTDRLWSEQIGASNTAAVGNAAYSLHVARSLCRALIYRASEMPSSARRAHLRAPLGSGGELNIARAFRDAMSLEESLSSLRSVLAAIQKRSIELGQMRARGVSADKLPDWVYTDPIEATSLIVEQANHEFKDKHRRWSLLFDELELAPAEIVRSLVSKLRGFDSLLNFKLSMAPVVANYELLEGDKGAIRGQDVEHIALTDMSKRSSSQFTQRLMESYLRSQTNPVMTPVRRLLGVSKFDDADASDGSMPLPVSSSSLPSAYQVGGSVWQAMKSLEDVDPSFAEYLDRKRIDLHNLDALTPAARAANVRKIRNLVVVRAYYKGHGRRRSRKSLELYAGAASLLAMPDGNPRMAMTLIRELAAELERPQTGRILSAAAQGRALKIVIDRFSALLSAQESEYVRDRIMTVDDLVERIGKSLAGRVIDGPFSSDPILSFSVDPGLEPNEIILVQRAINAGALINVPTGETSVLRGDADGSHYRLSYLLCAKYGLPIRGGKTMPLSRLLWTDPPNGRTFDPLQPELPGAQLWSDGGE